MEKLISEFEIALLFCGNGEDENSVKAILEVNKQFIEKAKLLLNKKCICTNEQNGEIRIHNEDCEKHNIKDNKRKAKEIIINLQSTDHYYEVNAMYLFTNVKKAKSFYQKLRKETGIL